MSWRSTAGPARGPPLPLRDQPVDGDVTGLTRRDSSTVARWTWTTWRRFSSSELVAVNRWPWIGRLLALDGRSCVCVSLPQLAHPRQHAYYRGPQRCRDRDDLPPVRVPPDIQVLQGSRSDAEVRDEIGDGGGCAFSGWNDITSAHNCHSRSQLKRKVVFPGLFSLDRPRPFDCTRFLKFLHHPVSLVDLDVVAYA